MLSDDEQAKLYFKVELEKLRKYNEIEIVKYKIIFDKLQNKEKFCIDFTHVFSAYGRKSRNFGQIHLDCDKKNN